MSVKKLFISIFSAFISIMFLFLVVGSFKDIAVWYAWWSEDRRPLTIEGSLESFSELAGKYRGRQYVWINNRGKISRFDSAFSKPTLGAISQANEDLRVNYYPTVTGSMFICFVQGKDTEIIFYNESFNDDFWPTIFVLIFFVFYLLMFLLFLIFFVIFFRKAILKE